MNKTAYEHIYDESCFESESSEDAPELESRVVN